VFEFVPTSRTVPITSTRITASITAYSAMSWPFSSVQSFRTNWNIGEGLQYRSICKRRRFTRKYVWSSWNDGWREWDKCAPGLQRPSIVNVRGKVSGHFRDVQIATRGAGTRSCRQPPSKQLPSASVNAKPSMQWVTRKLEITEGVVLPRTFSPKPTQNPLPKLPPKQSVTHAKFVP
jgi:hypothetical protein